MITSSTNVGELAPFPPAHGQPYPPSRNHARWKEIYRLHDEWLMKYWPFSNDRKRARIPFMNLAGFSTWCAPAADFDRMVWGGRLAGVFFLADDYVDSGKMLNRIPGFKKAATGTGPLNVQDRAENCHDIVFRAIKATCHPRTFAQLTKCTHEWWDSHIHEPYHSIDQYIRIRRVNIAMYFANAYFRYTLDINLTDEQVNHPLMREAEGIVSDHVGLTNDFFSYAKETLTNSDETNILRLLQDHEGLTYKEALDVVKQKIKQKEEDFIPAGLAVLNDPELGQDPEVHRWIASLPYCMGGNKAWSQESGRYNIGDLPGSVPFPSLECAMEDTPANEVIDSSPESLLRDRIFSKDAPLPDFSIDCDPIETRRSVCHPFPSLGVMNPRPQNVGILAIDLVTSSDHLSPEADQNVHAVASKALSSLLRKYDIDHLAIGRVEVCSTGQHVSAKTVVQEIFAFSDIEIGECKAGPAAAFFRAIDWIEGSFWDGRLAIVLTVVGVDSEASAVAMLVGPNASIIVEPSRGILTSPLSPSGSKIDISSSVQDYIDVLGKAYASYKRKTSGDTDTPITLIQPYSSSSHMDAMEIPTAEFDYMVYDGLSQDHVSLAHKSLNCQDSLSTLDPSMKSSSTYDTNMRYLRTDYETRVSPTFASRCSSVYISVASLFGRLACVIAGIPGYELFDKRISMFSFTPDTTSFFFVLRVVGDTKSMYEKLAARYS